MKPENLPTPSPTRSPAFEDPTHAASLADALREHAADAAIDLASGVDARGGFGSGGRWLGLRSTLFAIVVTVGAGVSMPAAGAPLVRIQAAPVSLGVGFGDPTALDLKLWAGNSSGFDFGIGLQRFSERLGVYGEFELGLVDFWVGSSVEGVFYLGIGGAIAFRHHSDDTSVALIVPIGLNFRFRAPVEIFVEARPGVELLDSEGFGIGGQIGVRYVF